MQKEGQKYNEVDHTDHSNDSQEAQHLEVFLEDSSLDKLFVKLNLPCSAEHS